MLRLICPTEMQKLGKMSHIIFFIEYFDIGNKHNRDIKKKKNLIPVQQNSRNKYVCARKACILSETHIHIYCDTFCVVPMLSFYINRFFNHLFI